MAFCLSEERPKDVVAAYRRYREYLEQYKKVFPPSAFELATSDWYFNPENHRSPHDAWLESLVISEPAHGDRNEIRETSIRIRLLGAYHDLKLEFFYPKVFSHSLISNECIRGLGDWRYDEFTLNEKGHVVHEIEWAGFRREPGSRWLICASDVQFNWSSL